jgi:hypothetical protein
LELPDEKAAGFWPAAGRSKKSSEEAADESETRELPGGALVFLRRIPTLSPTCERLRAQETGRTEPDPNDSHYRPIRLMTR